MTGAFGGKAVHDAVLVAVILPLDARYNPKVNFHRLHEITANALHDWFSVLVLLWRIFTEQTSSVDVRLRTHNIKPSLDVATSRCPY